MNIKNKIYLWVPSLYFIEGLPYAMVLTMAAIMYKKFGIDNAKIAFYVSLLYLPWVLKPLWAPILEKFGTKKKWVISTQFLLALFSFLLIFSLFSSYFFLLSLLIFFVLALISATHDTAADGLYLINLSAKQQVYYVGVRTLFYQLAGLFCVGGIVMLIGKINSWQIGFALLALVFLFVAIYHLKIIPEAEKVANKNGGIYYLDVIKSFFQLPRICLLISFLLLYNAAEAQLLRIVPLFLLDTHGGLGLSTADVGFIYGVVGTIAMVSGLLISGIIIAKIDIRRSFIPMTLIMCLVNIGYLILSFLRPDNLWLISMIIALGKFGFGLVNGAYLVFLIKEVVSEAYKTTFYAVGTALMALGFMFFGAISGYLQQLLGYRIFFIWIIVLGFGVLLFTVYTLKVYGSKEP